jgi:hypothetical protein
MVYDRPGWALVTFAVAGITDALDGLLARRSGPTTLGAWLDPMADKLLLATMFIVLTLPGLGLTSRIPLWLTILVISRDVAYRHDGGDLQSGGRAQDVQTIAARKGGHCRVSRHGCRDLVRELRSVRRVAGSSRRCTPRRESRWLSAFEYLLRMRRRRLKARSARRGDLLPEVVNRRRQPLLEGDLRFPAQQRARARDVRLATCGSSVGSGLKTIWLFEPVILIMSRAISSIVISWGLPMLTGSVTSDSISAMRPDTRSLM